MAETIYVLCALTGAACAVLLARGWTRTRVRLLWWSALCFAGLAVNNVLLFADLVLFPDTIDLAVTRSMTALASMTVLVVGLILEDA
jgi:hypothetical protein